jgi:hypothetical protein
MTIQRLKKLLKWLTSHFINNKFALTAVLFIYYYEKYNGVPNFYYVNKCFVTAVNVPQIQLQNISVLGIVHYWHFSTYIFIKKVKCIWRCNLFCDDQLKLVGINNIFRRMLQRYAMLKYHAINFKADLCL